MSGISPRADAFDRESLFGIHSELPSVAAMAAAEVDQFARNKEGSTTNWENLRQLETLLSTVVKEAQVRDRSTVSLLNPVVDNVLADSLMEYSGSKITSYDDLTRSADQLVSKLKELEKSDKKSEMQDDMLDQLKKFFVALSRYSLASLGAYEDSQVR